MEVDEDVLEVLLTLLVDLVPEALAELEDVTAPYWKTLILFAPPHISAAFPLHAMLQPVLPEAEIVSQELDKREG